MKPKIKICGIQNLEDAKFCESLGVDAIGLVFFNGSARNITIATAKEIADNLPPFITVVALFVNPKTSLVNAVLANVKVDCLQFHGEESDDFCQQFKRKWYKAIAMRQGLNLKQELKKYPNAQAILLDSYCPKSKGGTGKSFNWHDIPLDLAKPVILAGGLNADNIQQAIATVAPWAVDVSSGVEVSKGVKSQNKIKNLVELIRASSS